MNTWPLRPPNRSSFSFYDEQGIIGIEGVPADFIRQYPISPRFFKCSFTLSLVEMGILHQFWTTNLLGWFTMDLPTAVAGLEPQVVRLISDFETVRDGPDVWQVSFSLERAEPVAVLEFPVAPIYEPAGITYEEIDYIYGDFYIPTLIASILPTSLSTSYTCIGGACANPATLTSAAVTVTTSGGDGTYAVAWSWVSGDVLTVTSPTALTTTFSKALAYNTSTASVYRATITSGVQTVTLDLPIAFDYTHTASSLSLAADIDPATGTYDCVGTFTYCTSPNYITTAPVTVSVTGGSGTIVHSWTRISGDVLTINAPANGTTTFSGSIGRNETKTAVMRDTVTRGGDTAIIDVTASVSYTFTLDTGGGGAGPDPDPPPGPPSEEL